MSDMGAFLRLLFKRLQQSSIPYCVLRNWEDLPDRVGNDVDLWVDRARSLEFEDLLFTTARELDWTLVQRWHWLARRGDGLYVFVRPETRDCLIIDVFKHLTWKGLRYVDDDVFPRLMRPHPKGFVVLLPGAEAASIVVKEILFEGALREKYRAACARMAREDRAGFVAVLAPVAGVEMANRILDQTVAEQWPALASSRHRAKLEIAARSLARNPVSTLVLNARHFYFRARHRLRPPGGFFLVLIGPDGVGKTTTSTALLQTPLVRQLFSSTAYLYRRFPMFPELKAYLPPPLRRRLTVESEAAADASEEGIPPVSFARSMAYVLYYGVEYFLGRLWLWKECRLGNGIVVFDRYWYEFLLQARYDRCPRFVLRAVEALAARPDALVFLDAPPQVAYDRKREKPLAEIQRVHRLCSDLVARSSHGITVPALDLESTVERLQQVLLERLVERTRSTPHVSR